MTPNQITVLRVLLAFLAVALFAAERSGIGPHPGLSLVALALTILAISLDAVDGYVARRKHLATPLGAQLDILGDRVIENLFLTYFAVSGLLSVWVPVVFFVRGTSTDFIRGLAAQEGREGFGRNGMLETWWGRALVASRASRAAYAVLKCVCFCYLGAQLALGSGTLSGLVSWDLRAFIPEMIVFGQVLVILTVAFCLVRGLPVLWEGRRYLQRLGASHLLKDVSASSLRAGVYPERMRRVGADAR